MGWVASIATALAIFCGTLGCGSARAEDRTLDLFYVHTGERAQFTFKKNGRFDPAVLKKLNVFLRDWRRNEPTRMDPALFDLVWEVYQKSGARKPITVVSAYRSPATNNMLRRRTRGVAKNSQHTYGRAMDFFIADVPTSKLRVIALKMQHGGVGYYPTANTPFVHLDVGSVRHWPRMTRSQLLALFPNGRTLHVPSDNKPLPGYEEAAADYMRYKRGLGGSGQSTTVASSKSYTVVGDRGGVVRPPPGASKNLLAFLFGGGVDEEEDNSDTSGGAAVGGDDEGGAPAVQVASAAPARSRPVAELRASPSDSTLPGVASGEDAAAPAKTPAKDPVRSAPPPPPAVAVVPAPPPEAPAEVPAPELVVPATLPLAKAVPPAAPAEPAAEDQPTVVATLQVAPLPKPALAAPAAPAIVADENAPSAAELAAVQLPLPAPQRPATEIALAEVPTLSAMPLAKPAELVARADVPTPVLGYASAGAYNAALASAGPVDVLAETARGILKPRTATRPSPKTSAPAYAAAEEAGDGASALGLEPLSASLLTAASDDPFADDLVAPERNQPMLISNTLTVRTMAFATLVAPDISVTPEILVANLLPGDGAVHAKIVPGPRTDRFMPTDEDRLMMTASLP